MPSHAHVAHHRSLVIGTLGAAMAHGYLATLGFLGYLNYTVGTNYVLLNEIASDDLWAWIFTITAILLLVSVFIPYRRVKLFNAPFAQVICSVAFAAMLTWAFFTLLWGLSTTRPVSLAGPGLAFAVSAGEQLMAHAWNRGATTRDG